MPSSTVFVVAAFLFAYCSGSPLKKETSPWLPLVDYGNANLIVDLLLIDVNKQLPDIFAIPDIGGTFDLTNCFFRSEHGIKRDGDATLLIDGDNARLNSPLKAQNIRIDCTWHYLGLDGGAAGITDKVEITSGFYLLMQSGQHPWLTEFRAGKLDPISTEINGIGLLDWLAEDIAAMILNNMDEVIDEVLETTVRDAFQGVLDDLIIP